MTDEKLQEIHDNLWAHYILDPENLEKEISEIADSAAKQIVLGKNTTIFQFGDNVFVARLTEDIKGFQRVIRVVISNERSRETAGNRYIPYTVEAEIDNRFSALENYRSVFEAFLRHICGAVQPEVLE